MLAQISLLIAGWLQPVPDGSKKSPGWVSG